MDVLSFLEHKQGKRLVSRLRSVCLHVHMYSIIKICLLPIVIFWYVDGKSHWKFEKYEINLYYTRKFMYFWLFVDKVKNKPKYLYLHFVRNKCFSLKTRQMFHGLIFRTTPFDKTFNFEPFTYMIPLIGQDCKVNHSYDGKHTIIFNKCTCLYSQCISFCQCIKMRTCKSH